MHTRPETMVGRAVIFLLFCAICSAQEQEARMVALAQGAVRGYRAADGDYFAFYGIPYATAPTGRDKFKAPLPAPVWSEIFEATEKEIACPQPQGLIVDAPQIHQCLLANVFVPVTMENNLPVVVYVHGGAYIGGFGNMEPPTEIVNIGNFIAVNFNYRLGVHGFLCLGTENAPGNAGMKDMVQLLRWVKDNIASFGGNPDDVTISGASAGSAATDLLTFSKMTEGLYTRIVLESGAAISGWGVDVDPLASAKRYASLFNFTTDNVYELEEFYLTTPLDELGAVASDHNPDTSLPFVPCIERDTGSEMFLDDAPINILKNDEYKKPPFLVGYCEMEGRLRLIRFTEWCKMMNENFGDFLPADLQFSNEEEKADVARKVKEFYFGYKNASEETIQAFVDFQSDTAFIYPALRSVSLQAETGNEDIFLYRFLFNDETFQHPDANRVIDVFGAGHTAQSEALAVPVLSEHSIEYKEVKTLIRELWINFYKTGQPIPEGSFLVEGGWPSAGVNRAPYMAIDYPSRLESSMPIENRAKLWDEIYEKHYRIPIPPPTPPARDSWKFTEP